MHSKNWPNIYNQEIFKASNKNNKKCITFFQIRIPFLIMGMESSSIKAQISYFKFLAQFLLENILMNDIQKLPCITILILCIIMKSSWNQSNVIVVNCIFFKISLIHNFASSSNQIPTPHKIKKNKKYTFHPLSYDVSNLWQLQFLIS